MPEGFRIASAWVSVSPEMAGFKEELKGKLDEATAGIEGRVKVTLDTAELDGKVDEARAKVDELDGKRVEPSVHLATADLDARADEAKAKLDELDSKTARPDVGLVAADLDEKVEQARAKLDELDARRAEAHLNLNTAEFDAKLDEARAKLTAFNQESASPRVGGSGGGAAAGGAAGGGSGSMLGALAMGVGALMPGIGGAAAGLGMLGGVGALALGPVSKALGDAHQAALNVGLMPQQLAATQFSNQVQQEQAQQGLTSARQQAGQDAVTSAASITSAQSQLGMAYQQSAQDAASSAQQSQSAQMNLASVVRNAAAQQIQAVVGVEHAQQGLEEANYGLSQAQYNLTQAWTVARQEITQLNDQLADSQLNVQQAELAIKQAIYNQKLVNQNAYSTELDRQQSALAVAQAQQHLTDAQDQATTATYKANLANQQGVEHSQTLIQAKQGLVAAQFQQTDAQETYAAAQLTLTNTELNNATQLKEAQMQVAAAQRDSAYQQIRDAEQVKQSQRQLALAQEQGAYSHMRDAQSVAIAERNITNTIREQQLQMAATMSTSNEAANQFAKDMSRMTPAGRDMVNQILNMKDSFRGLQEAAQNAVAPGFTAFLQGVQTLMPTIQSGVTQMGNAIGGAFRQLGEEMSKPGAAKALDGLIQNGIQFANIVVPAFGGFVAKLGEIGGKKGAVDGLSNVLAGIAHGLTGMADAIGKNEKPINDFLSAVGVIIAQIGPPLGQMIGLVAQALAPLTGYLNAHPDGTVAKVIGDILAGMLALKGLQSVLPDVISKPLADLAGKGAGKVGDLLTAPFKSGASKISDILSTAFAAGGPWDGLRLQAMYAGENVVGGFKSLGSRVGGAISGWSSNIATAVKNIMPTKLDAQLFLSSVQDKASVVGEAFSTWGGKAVDAAKELGSKAATGIVEGMGNLAGKVGDLASGISSGFQVAIQAVKDFQLGSKLAAAATTIWEGIQAAFNLVMSANPIALVIIGIAALVAGVIYAYTHFAWFREVVQAAMQGIATAALWLWHNVLDPFWQALEVGAIWLYDHGIRPLIAGFTEGFHEIETAAAWLRDHILAPLWIGIQAGADSFIGSFKTSWDKLMDIFKVPVNFLISTVYTKGIEALWNGVVSAVGQDSLKLPDIQPFATGGVVPGYAPGQDTELALLSPGEGILVPEAVRALGPSTVLALNAAYGGGRVSTPGHYKGGGILDSIGSAWDTVTGGIGKAVDLGKIVAAIATGNTTALSNALTKLVGTNAVGNFAKVMLGVPTSLIGDLVKAIVGSPGSGGSSSTGGSIPTGQHLAIIDSALAAAGAPPPGTKEQWEAGLNTLIGRESGWNPRAINLTDSNAQAGDPSRGLAQTIMSTFLANHAPGTPMDIYDPVANVASSIRYIVSTYGNISNVQQANANLPAKGYDSGGWLMPGDIPVNGLRRPEAVLTPDQSQWLKAMAEHGTSSARGGGPVTVEQHFHGTQWPTAEQKAAMQRDLGLALGGAG